MYIIAGLGNPGREYRTSKHNIGFITLDTLAERHGIRVERLRFKALLGEGRIAGKKVLLAKPQTFMNASGESLREIMAYYKEPLENLLVIYDDIDLPMGRLRLKAKGSAGTHNGMRSIVYQLQEDGFPRLRVGIGAPRPAQMDLASYVLGGFSDAQKEVMLQAVCRAADAAECFLAQGIAQAMNLYNQRSETEGEEKKDG
jgi:PTH1 family peptidyl-tRNA hydrolase